MTAWRFLWRDLKAGELNLLFMSIVVAVTIIASIGLFAERLQKSLVAETNTFLAADAVLQSPDPVPNSWLQANEATVLHQAFIVQFPSMVFAGEDMYLASVKAVSTGYPLLGLLEVSQAPYGQAYPVRDPPGSGEAWLDSRLAGLLNVRVGGTIWVGEKELEVTRILIREPDAGSSYWSLGPRVMISIDDLEATAVVQDGSRVEYRYLFAGDSALLAKYLDWLSPKLGKRHRLLTLNDTQPGLAQSLKRARNFLLLAGTLGVLLASVAIAMAARRYGSRHLDTVALLKVLGISTSALRATICLPLLPLTLVAVLCGYGLGLLIEQGFLQVMREWLPHDLPAAGWRPYALGALTGLVCVLMFALPVLMQLIQISPLRILRRELAGELHSQRGIYALGFMALYGLMVFFSGEIWLVNWICIAVLAMGLVTAVVAFVILTVARHWGSRVGSAWRLALAYIRRGQAHSILQLVMFSLILMLLMTSVLIRSSLVREWQQQLPPGTPNQFLINIAPHEVEQVRQALGRRAFRDAGLYPMVRGRLVTINGKEATQVAREQVDELFRELNLTWSHELPEDNRLTEGQWWGNDTRTNFNRVSIESGLAKRLGIGIGDRLAFSIGDSVVEARVTSVRELSWDRMRPNFYFMFEPGSLEEFPATYITSFYLPEHEKPFLNNLVREFPTLSVFSIDETIRRIQGMVSQVTRAIEIVLWLILSAGLLVMIAIVQASLDERLRMSALLRSLGASRQLILGSLFWEFALLGASAGLLGAAGSTLATWLLQSQLFHLDHVFHIWPWIVGPCAGVVVVCSTGLLACAKVVRVPPWGILQGSLC